MATLIRIYVIMTAWIAVAVQGTAGASLSLTPAVPQVKRQGEGAILTCQVNDYKGPEPEMHWRDPGGNVITATSGRLHVERQGALRARLYLRNIIPEDAGDYTCEVALPGEEILKVNTKLLLFDDIEFVNSTSYMQFPVGADALIECVATGNPTPEISWRFNLKKLKPASDKYEYLPTGLLVRHLDLRDAGVYECRAEVTSQGNLKVKKIMLELLYPPVITHKPPEQTIVMAGSTAELRCMAHGAPDPYYQWYKEQQMSSDLRVKVKLAEGIDTHTIQNIVEEDEGRYFCKMSNELGAKEVYTDLIVRVPPVVADIAPEHVLEASPLVMTCTARGRPTPIVTWQRVGKLDPYVPGLQPDDPQVSVDSTQPGISKLTIYDIQRHYTGQYACTAVNEAGTDTRDTSVNVEFIPSLNTTDHTKEGWAGQVRNFTCTGYGNPLPTITWAREGDYVTNSDTFDITATETDVMTSTLQVTLREDEPWVYGGYSCTAKNKYNYVKKSVYLTEAKTPGPLHNVTIRRRSPNSVTLTFTQLPAEDVSPLTTLRVKYELSKNNREENQMTQIFKITDPVLVTGLRAGSQYVFYLAAGNKVGYGEEVKFKVKTSRRLSEETLSDLPRTSTKSRRPVPPPDETQEEDKPDKQLLGGGALGATSGEEENTTAHLAMIIGITAVLAVLIVVIIIAIVWMRRKAKRDDYVPGGMIALCGGRKPHSRDFHPPMSAVQLSDGKDVDKMQLEIRRTDSSATDAGLKTPDFKRKSPSEIRKNGVAGAGIGKPSSKAPKSPIFAHHVNMDCTLPTTIQEMAWDRMLHEAMTTDDPEAEMEFRKSHPEAMHMLPNDTDLPPPPPFLLENQDHDNEDSHSYHDILDGYHSEENIDDVEEENFEIRLPPPYYSQHVMPS